MEVNGMPLDWHVEELDLEVVNTLLTLLGTLTGTKNKIKMDENQN